MGQIRDTANSVYTDGPTGNPSTPSKERIRTLFATVEDVIDSMPQGYDVSYETRAQLYADLNWSAGSIGRVFGDSNEPYKGIYKKSGASGSGSWARIGPLPGGDTSEIRSDLDNEIAQREGAVTAQVNLFVLGTEIIGQSLKASGGDIEPNSPFWSTDFISVSAGLTYSHTPPAVGKIYAFYNSSSVFISQVTSTGKFTVPSGASKVRGCARRLDTPPESYVLVQGETIPSLVRGAPLGVPGVDGDGKVAARILRSTRTINLFDKQAIVEGAYIDPTGNGVSDPLFYESDFIRVVPGRVYSWSSVGLAKYVNFYNSSGTWISGSGYIGTVTAPTNAAFARISMRYSEFLPEQFMFVEGSVLPVEYQPFAGASAEVQINKNRPYGYAGLDGDGRLAADVLPPSTSPLLGKTIAGLGDSITYGFIPRNAPGYPGQLSSWLPLVGSAFGASVFNYGISGSTLADNGTGENNPFTQRFSAMDDAADLIIVMGGTNDVRKGVPLGAMGDTTDLTYFGALDVLCEGLLQKYRYTPGTTVGATKKIMFMTAIRLLDDGEAGDLDPNLPAYNAAMKQVCAKYGIPVFDAYNLSGLTPELFRTLVGTEPGYTDNYNPYVTDGVHPTQEGHRIFADAVAGFIRSLY